MLQTHIDIYEKKLESREHNCGFTPSLSRKHQNTVKWSNKYKNLYLPFFLNEYGYLFTFFRAVIAKREKHFLVMTCFTLSSSLTEC